MKTKNFIFLEHTADVKFQAFGKNLNEVFENSALAMFNVMYDGNIKEKKRYNVKVEGKDNESLLYNFLEELLFLLDSKNFFLSKIKKLKIDKIREKLKLKAEITGDDAGNYRVHLEVKAVTYNEMFVKKEKNKYITQVVLDV